MSARFASVVLDVDSTLTGIEGIDWLARRRGEPIASEVAVLTAAAMDGRRKLGDAYARRLELVRPTSSEVEALGLAYVQNAAADARQTISVLRNAGVRVVLVSAGLRDAVVSLADFVGVPHDDVRAVALSYDPSGAYLDYDRGSPLCSDLGKRRVVQSITLPRPVLAVGDGMSDAEILPAADAFAAFTGFVHREAVVARASYVLTSFADLESLVLGAVATAR